MKSTKALFSVEVVSRSLTLVSLKWVALVDDACQK